MVSSEPCSALTHFPSQYRTNICFVMNKATFYKRTFQTLHLHTLPSQLAQTYSQIMVAKWF